MPLLLDLVYFVVAIVTIPFWARKGRSGWRERFGKTAPLPEKGRARLLIHAVSVGEVNLIRLLVERLAGEVEIVVSVTTDTGIARARQLFGGRESGVWVVRTPLDASFAVRRFLDATRPDAVALVELEVWPNFLLACARRGVPVSVINGRLSKRSFKRYRLIHPLIAPFFRRLAFVAAQDETYAERFRALGAEAGRVRALGSMKWDAAEVAESIGGAERLAEQMGIDRGRPLIVGGSTAPEEHALLRDARPRGAQLLCAPRRPEWWDPAAETLAGCVRRSSPEAARHEGADLFLLDTIGELRQAYALADVVVIGRSFGELYGSDPMEPAALGKPVVIGPACEDFRAAVDALREAGGLIETTREELASELRSLVEDERRRARMAEAAKRCVEERQGATERHAELLRELLRG